MIRKLFIGFLIYLIGGFPTLVFALPQGGEVVSGTVGINTPNANNMAINQGSNQAIVNWQGFDIGKQESVTINQPNSNSVILNRVIGENPSAILGKLSANGQVFLTNPSGILFGQGAQVNVGALVASTLNISNQDFLDRNYRFTQDANKPLASIINLGDINAGSVGLVAPRVENHGNIVASLGSVAIASGEKTALDFEGDGLINFEITEPVSGEIRDGNGNVIQSGVINSGLIQANGGRVVLSASQAQGMIQSVVNNEGMIEAKGVEERDGKIFLLGADEIINEGTLDVSGTEPGQTGGEIRLLGEEVFVKGGILNASGDAGGGTILIGGDQQGQNTNIQNAKITKVAASAKIHADAIRSGDGGKIIVWADNSTVVKGLLTARGGAQSGDGGFVETSGKNSLVVTSAPDVSAKNGQAGTWLLDPTNIEIVSGPGNGDGSQVSVTTIETALNAGTSVHIITSGQGLEEGTITVSTAIVKSSGGDTSLTLTAHGDINVNQSITSTSGALAVNLVSGADIFVNAAIVTNGGNLLADAGATNLPANISGAYMPAARISGAAVVLPKIEVNADIITGGGSVTLGQFKTKQHSLIGGGTYTKENHAVTDVVVQTFSINTGGGDFKINGSAITVASTATVTSPGGNILIESTSEAIVGISGVLNVANAASSQTGGTIHVLGYKVGLFDNAELDASGDAGGGIILIGGDYQGKNENIQNAYRTYVGKDTVIKADATNTGNGGKVIVWADDTTRFYGDIFSRGGSMSGDGGFVETSGKNFLDAQGYVNTLAVNGNIGTWLLDPTDVVVANGGGAALTAVDQFADAGGTITIDAATINVAASNVTIQANNNITINEAISISTAGITLTLQAGDDIIVNQNITTNNAAISFTANDAGGSEHNTGTNGVITMADGTTVDAGNAIITFSAQGDITLGRVVTTNAGATAISLTSTAGGIVDGGDTGGVDIETTSGRIVISAQTGIGISGSNAIDIDAGTVDMTNATSGGISIAETSGFTIINMDSSAANGAITVATSGNMSIADNSVKAGSGNVSINSTAGQITDSDGGTTASITTTGSITLIATTDIGGADAVEVTSSTNLTVNANQSIQVTSGTTLTDLTITLDPGSTADTYTITDGSMTLNLTDNGTGLFFDVTSVGNLNVTLTQDTGDMGTGVSTNINSGNLSLTASAGSVTVIAGDTINANNVTLTAIGSISDVSINAAITTVSGGAVTLAADDSIIFASTGSISASGAGNVSLTSNANVADGNNGDAITMADGSSVDAGSGTITLTSTGTNSGSITLSLLTTTSSSNSAVTLTVDTASSILDTSDSNGLDVDAANGRLVMSATNGIGSANALEITVDSVDATNSSSNSIVLTETDSISVINLNSANQVTLTATLGTITIESSGSGVTSNNGDINITANGTTSNLVVNKAITSGSGGGQIELKADNNITLMSGINLTPGTGNLHLIADNDSNGTGTITGQATLVMNGGGLQLSAGSGVGTSGSTLMSTGVTSLAGGTTTGGFYLTNTGGSAMTITTVNSIVGVSVASGGGDVQLSNVGGTFATLQDLSALNATADIKITAAGMTIGAGSNVGDIISNGSINITATGSLFVTAVNQIIAEGDAGGSLAMNISAAGLTLNGGGAAGTESLENAGSGNISITSSGAIALKDHSIGLLTGTLNINAGTNTITKTASSTAQIASNGSISITAGGIGTGTALEDIILETSIVGGSNTLSINLNNGGDAFLTTAGGGDDSFNQFDISVASASSEVSMTFVGGDFLTFNPSSGQVLTATLNNFDTGLNFALNDSNTTLNVGNITAGDSGVSSEETLQISSNANIAHVSGSKVVMSSGLTGSLRLVGIKGIGTSTNPFITNNLKNFAATANTGGIFLTNNVGVVDLNSTTVSSTVGVVASAGDIIIKNTTGGFDFTDIIKADSGNITLESAFALSDLNGTATSLSAANGSVTLTVSSGDIGTSGNPIEVSARSFSTNVNVSGSASVFVSFTNTTPAETTPDPTPTPETVQEPIFEPDSLPTPPPVGGNPFDPDDLEPILGRPVSQEEADAFTRGRNQGNQTQFVQDIGDIVKGPGC